MEMSTTTNLAGVVFEVSEDKMNKINKINDNKNDA